MPSSVRRCSWRRASPIFRSSQEEPRQDALAMVAELQEAFVEQTKKYGERGSRMGLFVERGRLAKRVREQQNEFGRDLREAF